MRLGDAGSSWCKMYSYGSEVVEIVPARLVFARSLEFDWGTGHTARSRSANYENDLISLSAGALAMIESDSFTVLDLGSRDAKLVEFKERRPIKLDWSVGCAAATGATLEMLGKFYDVDWAQISPSDKWTPVTCGTYAVERILEQVSCGEPVEEALGRFIHGLARNCYDFSGRPEELYLSGGFVYNPAFLEALGNYTHVRTMGRTLPLAGLWSMARKSDPGLGNIPSAIMFSKCIIEAS